MGATYGCQEYSSVVWPLEVSHNQETLARQYIVRKSTPAKLIFRMETCDTARLLHLKESNTYNGGLGLIL